MLTPPKRPHQCNAPFVGWRSGRSPALPPGLPAQVVLAPHHVTAAAGQPCSVLGVHLTHLTQLTAQTALTA
jgi:hypothetical protein